MGCGHVSTPASKFSSVGKDRRTESLVPMHALQRGLGCLSRKSCAGVIVVGATSRPDMLDAALLRPGRLDRLLYCGFPTARERLQVRAARPPCPAAPWSCMPRHASLQSISLSQRAHARSGKSAYAGGCCAERGEVAVHTPAPDTALPVGSLLASPVARYRRPRVC